MPSPSTAPATGTSVSGAIPAFEAILSGESQDMQDESKAQPVEDDEDDTVDEVQDENADQADDGEQDEAQKAEDEPADDGDEGESDEGEEAEDDEGEEQAYTVRVDGQEVDVPLSELIKGYSRTADYTRKTQEVAAMRKAAETEAVESRALREQYAQRLEHIDAILQEADGQEPNWDQLRAEDPIEFAAQWAEHQRRAEVKMQVRAEQQRVQQLRAGEQQRVLATQLDAARAELLKAIPEWKDESKAKVERAAMKEFGKKIGFTDEELGQVADHRAVVLLRKAMKYDAMVAKRGDIKPAAKPAPKPMKPGSAATTKVTKTGDLSRAKQRLAKSGTTRDAAELFKFLI